MDSQASASLVIAKHTLRGDLVRMITFHIFQNERPGPLWLKVL
jgi:hypothetical protein